MQTASNKEALGAPRLTQVRLFEHLLYIQVTIAHILPTAGPLKFQYNWVVKP